MCLFGISGRERGSVARLASAVLDATPRAVIAVDEEGGDVTTPWRMREDAEYRVAVEVLSRLRSLPGSAGRLGGSGCDHRFVIAVV